MGYPANSVQRHALARMKMKKSDVKTWADLKRFAKMRARKSLRRNDPLAYAYWDETWSFANTYQHTDIDPVVLRIQARDIAGTVQDFVATGDTLRAAFQYSRVKWFTILGRNNGWKMPRKECGTSLDWLRKLDRKNF
jgi:hypothetical protein